MSEPPYMGIMHNDEGLSIVGPDGWPDLIQPLAELDAGDEPRALDVPTIDVAPESVADTEIGD